MGADYVVALPCEPKLSLGDGDPTAGMAVMLDLVKSANRAALLRQIAIDNGDDPATLQAVVRVRNADGSITEKPLSLPKADAEAGRLAELGHACSGCPANVHERPFGCTGALRYPIARGAEEWVMSHLQPAESLGGRLLVSAIKDFDITGATAAGARKAGMFESRSPVKITIAKKLFTKTQVTSDQFFDALLFVGALNPSHCLGILLWLGAIELDGRRLLSADESPRALTSLSVEERLRRTKLAMPESGEFSDVRGVLGSLMKAWQNDVPLFMDA